MLFEEAVSKAFSTVRSVKGSGSAIPGSARCPNTILKVTPWPVAFEEASHLVVWSGPVGTHCYYRVVVQVISNRFAIQNERLVALGGQALIRHDTNQHGLAF